MDPIGPYSKSIRQQQLGGSIINNNVGLTYMTILDSTTGWFKIVKIPTYKLNKVMGGNDKYIYK